VSLWGAGARAEEAASSAEPAPAPAAEVAAKAPGWEFDVGAREEYRFRGSAGESSHELRLDLDFGARSPAGHFQALGDLTLWWQAARTPPEDSGAPFGLNTIYAGRNPWFNVFQLWGEYAADGVLKIVRVGRQEAEHGRPAAFDGGYVLLRPVERLALFAFGGRSEHFFETNMPLFEDWIASAGGVVRIVPGLRVEADYRLLREDVPALEGRLPVTDHSYGLAASYRSPDLLTAKLAVRALNDSLSEVSGVVRVFLPKHEFGVDAHLYFQPVELGEHNELDNPYFLTLGRSLPHARWKLDLYKLVPLGKKGGVVEAHLGWAGRQLLSDPQSAFNRNEGRLYGMLAVRDLGLKGLFAQLWLDRLSDRAFPVKGKGLFAVNAALGYDREWIRGELGTQYHRWEYVYYQDVQEIADVRVFYVEATVKPLSWLSVRGRYSVEVFDRTLHTATLTLAQAY
jgi:hypothetical protein